MYYMLKFELDGTVGGLEPCEYLKCVVIDEHIFLTRNCAPVHGFTDADILDGDNYYMDQSHPKVIKSYSPLCAITKFTQKTILIHLHGLGPGQNIDVD